MGIFDKIFGKTAKSQKTRLRLINQDSFTLKKISQMKN